MAWRARSGAVLAAVGAAAASAPISVYVGQVPGAGSGLMTVAFVIPMFVGFAMGALFGQRERDVAFPMPIATPVVAFAFAVVMGLPAVLALLGMLGYGGP
jgi:hypothetical protein